MRAQPVVSGRGQEILAQMGQIPVIAQGKVSKRRGGGKVTGCKLQRWRHRCGVLGRRRCMALSLNFLSPEQLRAAQRNPDKHTDLQIRLFGLSARFIGLSHQLQLHVIERMKAAPGRPGGEPGT